MISKTKTFATVLQTARRCVGLLAAAAFFIIHSSAASAAVAPEPGDAPLWYSVDTSGLRPSAVSRFASTQQQTVGLNQSALQGLLARAPMEGARPAADVVIDLPWPSGGFRRFRIEESPIMEEGMAAQFPMIKTYRGTAVDDPSSTVRFDWTTNGFHAMVFSGAGTVLIDPYAPDDIASYRSYFKRDLRRTDGNTFRCLVDGSDAEQPEGGAQGRDSQSSEADPGFRAPHGGTLRTYRLALAATGEYTAFFGGTVSGAISAMVTTLNRVNGIYERDLAVRMVLVANTSLVVYTNGSTDPYTNNNGNAMLNENQANLNAVIGTANYDVGHVFSTGGGGVATLNGPCAASTKARGVTGSFVPTGDAFDVDYVAHEIGHQFGAPHTFNGTTGSCGGGNRTANHAFEVGSGSTIMAYAGICGTEDLQSNSDAYFHAASLSDIVAFITGAGNACAVGTATGNTPPTVNAGLDYSIPRDTPFTLTAVGSDADGDSLTYDWEEMDLGSQSPPHTDDGSRPLFRSFLPTSSPSRTFPKLQNLLNNTTSFGELLPSTTRTMSFRVTARDNRVGGGGTADDDMVLSVRADSGPFRVLLPNAASTFSAGATVAVSWGVANTTADPINASSVRILLSTDGGNTFPTTLVGTTPNDGAESVVLPTVATTQARIKIEALGNVFFDVSDADFTINVAAPTLSINDVTVTEGASGAVNASFTVSLSPAAASTVTVTYQTANGSAAAGSDYVAVAPTVLTFAAGETTKTVSVQVSHDVLVEPTETFFVNLSAATGGATIGDSQGLGSIQDDDGLTCPAMVAPGSSFTTTLLTGSSASDWAAVYAASAGNNPVPAGWRYVPLPRPNVQTFTAPGSVGNYEVRLFANDTYTRIGTCAFSVAILPTLSIGDVTVTEGNSGSVNADFVVTLSSAAASAVTVQYQTANVTATAGADYTAAPLTTLTFTAGQTTRTLSVPVLGDLLLEPTETFYVNLSNASVGTSIGDGQGIGTIQDDDSPPALTCPSSPVAPGATFSVTANAGTSARDWLVVYPPDTTGTWYPGPIPTNWRYVPLPRPSTQVFTASTTAGVYVARLFANDTFSLISSCEVTVAVVPTASINDVSVTEGHTGTVNATFTVTLSPAAAGTVTLQYATAAGTATAGPDYTTVAPTTLTFLAGETSKTVTVSVVGDAAVEPNETFFVNLSDITSGSAIGDAQGLGTILDDDAPPAMSCPAVVAPGASFSATVQSGSSAMDWMGAYAVGAPNSPIPSGWRYVPLPRPSAQSFTASNTPGSYQLRLFANDTYTLIGTCSFTVAVVPTLSINDVSVTEGASGTTNATFTISLTPSASGTVTVQAQTAPGTATSGTDYVALPSTTVTFTAGQTSQTVTVAANGDSGVEANETFFVNLTGATGGAIIGDSQGMGTILDDDAPPVVSCPAIVAPGATFQATVNGGSSAMDWMGLYPSGAPNSPPPMGWRYVPLPRPNLQTFVAPGTPGSYVLRLFGSDSYTLLGTCPVTVATVPTLSVNDVSVTEGNAGTANATFTATLSMAAAGTVTVQYQTANGTATAGSDYQAVPTSTLTFNAGETGKTVTVLVNGDVAVEANETFFLNLANATGGAIIGDGQGQATIVDDDGPPPLACPTTVTPGSTFNITVNSGSTSMDWLGLYASGAPSSPVPANWRYVPLPRPNVQGFTAPGTSGTYELRLFANDTYTLVASCPVIVTAGARSPSTTSP